MLTQRLQRLSHALTMFQIRARLCGVIPALLHGFGARPLPVYEADTDAPPKPVNKPIETFESFKARVEEACGFPYDTILRGDENALLRGQVVCRFGFLHLVTAGPPDRVDEDGTEYWETHNGWRIVDTEGHWEYPC